MMKRFLTDEGGATAIEYALIAGLIFLAILASVEPIGIVLSAIFGQANDGLQSGGG